MDSSNYAYEPAAAADSNGVLTMVWSDSGNILARRYMMPPTTAGETCTGDCDCNREVTVDELITDVSIALHGQAARFGSCPAFDANADGQVTIDELVSAVEHALNGCADE